MGSKTRRPSLLGGERERERGAEGQREGEGGGAAGVTARKAETRPRPQKPCPGDEPAMASQKRPPDRLDILFLGECGCLSKRAFLLNPFFNCFRKFKTNRKLISAKRACRKLINAKRACREVALAHLRRACPKTCRLRGMWARRMHECRHGPTKVEPYPLCDYMAFALANLPQLVDCERHHSALHTWIVSLPGRGGGGAAPAGRGALGRRGVAP